MPTWKQRTRRVPSNIACGDDPSSLIFCNHSATSVFKRRFNFSPFAPSRGILCTICTIARVSPRRRHLPRPRCNSSNANHLSEIGFVSRFHAEMHRSATLTPFIRVYPCPSVAPLNFVRRLHPPARPLTRCRPKNGKQLSNIGFVSHFHAEMHRSATFTDFIRVHPWPPKFRETPAPASPAANPVQTQKRQAVVQHWVCFAVPRRNAQIGNSHRFHPCPSVAPPLNFVRRLHPRAQPLTRCRPKNGKQLSKLGLFTVYRPPCTNLHNQHHSPHSTDRLGRNLSG
jgi:hypothetical protein